MAKTKSILTRWLSRMGKGIFGFISRHQDDSRLGKALERIKLPLLGFFVMILGWLVTGTISCSCYVPTSFEITETEVTPNPTQGADSVTIKALCSVRGSGPAERRISSGQCYIENSSDTVQMDAVDGEFSDRLEEIEGKISVAEYPPGSVTVYVEGAFLDKEDEERRFPEYEGLRDSVILEITEEN